MSDLLESTRTTERASPSQRTKVIILAEVALIVALLVLWSLRRARRCCPEG